MHKKCDTLCIATVRPCFVEPPSSQSVILHRYQHYIPFFLRKSTIIPPIFELNSQPGSHIPQGSIWPFVILFFGPRRVSTCQRLGPMVLFLIWFYACCSRTYCPGQVHSLPGLLFSIASARHNPKDIPIHFKLPVYIFFNRHRLPTYRTNYFNSVYDLHFNFLFCNRSISRSIWDILP